MSDSKLPHDQIESYLMGRMDDSEVISFEKKMHSDELLRAEVDFQRLVVDGLGVARKQALKARLAEVPVSSSWLYNTWNTTWVKATTGLLIASSAAVIYYVQLPSDHVLEVGESIIADAPVPRSTVQLVIPEKLDPVELPMKEEVSVAELVTVDDHANDSEELASSEQLVKEITITIDEVVVPEVDLDFADEVAEEEQNHIEALEGSLPANFDVIFEASARLYKYFEGQLVLKGDYHSVDYDLIEINSSEGKKYYIEIEGIYYAMPVSQEFRSLEKIADKSLISRLDSLSTTK